MKTEGTRLSIIKIISKRKSQLIHTHIYILTAIPISPIILIAGFRYYIRSIAILDIQRARAAVYTSHQPVVMAILTFSHDSGGGKLLFIIVWHTVANDPCRVDTR